MSSAFPSLQPEHKWRAVAWGYVVFAAGYTLTGSVHFREPQPLPLLAIDRLIPFIPWTMIVYQSQFLFLFVCFWLHHQSQTITRTFHRMAVACAISFTTFLIFPTIFPRTYPDPQGWLAGMYQTLHAIDAPTNCFPSLHVALAFLAALGVMEEHGWRSIWTLVWALAITLSTLTTKQHYAVDLAGGFLVVLAAVGVVKGLKGHKGHKGT